MTGAAVRFIAPLTLEALSGQPVLTDVFSLGPSGRIEHIEAVRSVDLMIVAHARSLGVILVTNNQREFKRVDGLTVENWA